MLKQIRLLFTIMASLLTVWGHAQTYCAAGPSSTADSEITNVALSGDNFSISNLATCPGTASVVDYTATDSADVSLGTSYTLNVTFSTCGGVYSGFGRAWIDWNQDGDFLDAGEELGSWGPGSPAPQNTTTFNASFSFAAPTTATLGATRMRVMQRESGSAASTTPCATFTWGAVEDYTIVVTNTPPPCPTPGAIASVPSGNSAVISWVSTGSAFDIEYGPIGFTVGTGTSVTSTTTSTTLTGLTSNTGYDVYVRNNCTAAGSGTSAWSLVHTFFTTCGTFSTFPWVENFEGSTWVASANFSTSGDAIDQCWDRNPTSYPPMAWLCHTGTTGSSGTGPNSANSGNNYMFTETSSGTTGSFAYLELPAFDMTSLNAPLFSYFYHRYGATMGNLDVQVSLDTGATWTTVFTKTGAQQSANADPWAEELVDLTNYKSAYTLIRFRATKGSSFTGDMAIDDVRLEEAPPCPKPTALSASNITSSSATISWLSSGTIFVVEYGPAGYQQGTGLLDTVTAGSINLTGLAGNTTYDVYVLNDCSSSGNGISAWGGPATFTTLCNAQATPYFEGFESGSPGSSVNMTVPNCWFNYESGPSTAYGYVTSSTAYARTGVRGFYTYCVGSANDTFMLISPEIDSMDVNYKRIEFWARAVSTSTIYNNKIVIGTVAGPASPGSFAPIDTIDVGANTTFSYYQVFIDPANGYNQSHKFIAIMTAGAGGTSPTLVGYDDIEISNVPSCTPSQGLAMSMVTNNSAMASWTVGGGLSYQLEYGPTGFTQGTGPVITGITTNSYNLTGLAGNTCYDIYVRDSCAGAMSPWFGPVTFCTPCDPQNMPFTQDFNNWPPSCFELTNSTGWDWDQDPAGYARARFWNYSTGIAYMTSGPINITTGAQVKFKWAHQYNTSYPDDRVILRSRIVGTTTWDTIVDLVGPSFNSPGSGTTTPPANASDFVDFLGYLDTSYIGNQAQFEFLGITDFGPNAYIDDFVVEAVPSCTTPFNLAASNVTSSGADITWSSINGTCFKIEYGPTGFIQGTGNGTTISNATSPTSITGLSANTVYDVYVADCCDSTNFVGPISFQTLCNSQLNGSYTVGGATADFATLDSAMTTLTGCGVTGPVTFNLQGGTHVIGSQLIDGNIAGMSATNTVTISGGGVATDTILFTSGSVGFDFDGGGNFVFEDVTVNGAATGRTFWLHNGANNISFDNCHLWNNPTATLSTTGVIVASNTATSNFATGDNANNITVQNSKLVGGYCGAIFYGSNTSNYSSGVTIENCEIEDVYYYGLRFYYMEDIEVVGNTITGSAPIYGMYSYYWNDIKVERNHLIGTTSALYSGYVNVYRTDTPAVRSSIKNNFLVGGTTYGNYNYAARFLDYAHNSVNNSGTYGAYFSATTSAALASYDVNIYNNIFVGGTNYALYIFANNFQNLSADYNIFFTGGSNLAYWNAVRTDLAALKAADLNNNQNSLSGDPGYISATDLHIAGTLPNDAGLNGYATDDIDGDSRPASGSTNVDIGADEFTPLQNDAAMEAMLVALAGCGDSATEVSIVVKNFGINTINSLPVTVMVSGGVTATLNATSTNTIAPGATDTILVGTINTYAGANGVNFMGYTQLANDQKSSNDTMMVGPGAYVPFEPQYYPEDTVCSSVDSASFAAVSVPGAMYGWYASLTDTIPVATGDTFTFAVGGQTTWYLEYLSNADSLLTTFAAGNGQNGNMFDLVVKNTVTITGFTINNSTSGAAEVYYKSGSYVGSETTPANWTNLTTTPITISTSSGPTYFDLPAPITLASGQTHAFYVTMSTGSVSYTNGSSIGSVYASNADLDFLEGIGKSYPFGSTFSPRIWNGVIHYGSVGCSDVRQTLTLGLNTDTAVAAYSFNVQTNGSDVDFDASASSGHVYSWDFGDNNTGSGMMTSHTYATAGTYNVCLYVTDTVCNTTDTLCQDVTATIGIEESLMNQTLTIYPNPNNGTFRVEFQVEGLQDVELRVVSLLGQVMFESKPGNISGSYREEIDLSDEAAGVYVLQLVTENGTISRRVTVRK